MALISGNLAYFLYVRGQRSIEVSEATLFNYLQPVFTIPLAIFWLGEKLSTSFMVGAIIIAAGLIIAERKDKRYNNNLKR
jgi:drug/metabolite transporter (DMT)-like permease